MAITRSAKKAHRQSLVKKGYNETLKKNLRAAMKGVREAKEGDSIKAVAAAYKAIDKAAKKGVLKKNTADRRKALVSRMVKGK
ncbi:MAG TPA: 30S ribosomal protein S20 [Candidatus Paceibacterota bacterium]|nr:30S ribosomal protein S20 [Candidatus Paceibacterota bacterium]